MHDLFNICGLTSHDIGLVFFPLGQCRCAPNRCVKAEIVDFLSLRGQHTGFHFPTLKEKVKEVLARPVIFLLQWASLTNTSLFLKDRKGNGSVLTLACEPDRIS